MEEGWQKLVIEAILTILAYLLTYLSPSFHVANNMFDLFLLRALRAVDQVFDFGARKFTGGHLALKQNI